MADKYKAPVVRKKVGKDTGYKTTKGRPLYQTKDGELVSEKSRTLEIDGKYVNVPSIHDGVMFESEDTLREMLLNGIIEPTSTHETLEEAIEAAKERSKTLIDEDTGRMLEAEINPRKYADGGAVLEQDGGSVDPVSGNEVPPGSTQEEVRDDIDAKLSEGEFVLPADVVRYHGLEKIMELRDEAKRGMKRMEEMGQMGNSDEAVSDPDAPFDPESFELSMDDIVMYEDDDDKERKYQVGGYVAPYGTQTTGPQQYTMYTPPQVPGTAPPTTPAPNMASYQAPFGTYTAPQLPQTQPPLTFGQLGGNIQPGTFSEIKQYVGPNGDYLFVPFVNGQPTQNIPQGYTERTFDPISSSPSAQQAQNIIAQGRQPRTQQEEGGFDAGTAAMYGAGALGLGAAGIGIYNQFVDPEEAVSLASLVKDAGAELGITGGQAATTGPTPGALSRVEAGGTGGLGSIAPTAGREATAASNAAILAAQRDATSGVTSAAQGRIEAGGTLFDQTSSTAGTVKGASDVGPGFEQLGRQPQVTSPTDDLLAPVEGDASTLAGGGDDLFDNTVLANRRQQIMSQDDPLSASDPSVKSPTERLVDETVADLQTKPTSGGQTLAQDITSRIESMSSNAIRQDVLAIGSQMGEATMLQAASVYAVQGGSEAARAASMALAEQGVSISPVDLATGAPGGPTRLAAAAGESSGFFENIGNSIENFVGPETFSALKTGMSVASLVGFGLSLKNFFDEPTGEGAFGLFGSAVGAASAAGSLGLLGSGSIATSFASIPTPVTLGLAVFTAIPSIISAFNKPSVGPSYHSNVQFDPDSGKFTHAGTGYDNGGNWGPRASMIEGMRSNAMDAMNQLIDMGYEFDSSVNVGGIGAAITSRPDLGAGATSATQMVQHYLKTGALKPMGENTLGTEEKQKKFAEILATLSESDQKLTAMYTKALEDLEKARVYHQELQYIDRGNIEQASESTRMQEAQRRFESQGGRAQDRMSLEQIQQSLGIGRTGGARR